MRQPSLRNQTVKKKFEPQSLGGDRTISTCDQLPRKGLDEKIVCSVEMGLYLRKELPQETLEGVRRSTMMDEQITETRKENPRISVADFYRGRCSLRKGESKELKDKCVQ